MSRVAVIGEPAGVRRWELTGVRVLTAEDADQVRSAWQSLGAEIQVVLLTQHAAGHLADQIADPGDRLPVVLPP
jgi:vacuolar-type H+-ATPase subunit F/Vma7